MPFNAIPVKDFFNREDELAYLRLLVCPKDAAAHSNVMLQGAWGMGKTELLKLFFREVFWEDRKVVPFYYSFRSASLQAGSFAKDYFMRFVRQYLSFVKKDPAIADTMSMPLTRLMPVISSSGLDWMIELIGNFQLLGSEGSLHEQVLGAISAPVTAAREGGMRVLIMLDDFPLAARLYEAARGDSPGLSSLFEGSIKSPLCCHILTGSPDGILERIFADNAFRGRAERVAVGPLYEAAALSLFGSLCEKMGISTGRGVPAEFIRLLGGNPLYIRNMAGALRRMRRKEITEKDLWECYSFEVTEGEIAFYWASVLAQFITDERRQAAVKLLMRSVKSDVLDGDRKSLAAVLGVSEDVLTDAAGMVKAAGLVLPPGKQNRRDAVFEDFLQGVYMKEIEGRTSEKARALIEKKYYPGKAQSESFEVVIPMASDAELVAAKAFEQICRNINLDREVIRQIQTALIESCINAIEHSGSYDRKVFIRFTVDPGRLEIAIESPGRFFDPETVREPLIEEKLHSADKRGWGLKLMRKIMDEVRVERDDDLTRVTLVKIIRSNEVSK